MREDSMKKKVLCYLLTIVGVFLLVGFIASCGDPPDSDPEFGLVVSEVYTAANEVTVGDRLYKKYFLGKEEIGPPMHGILFATYRDRVEPIIMNEVSKKQPAVGLFLVINVYEQRWAIQWFTDRYQYDPVIYKK
jgi:hypothetical protein